MCVCVPLHQMSFVILVPLKQALSLNPWLAFCWLGLETGVPAILLALSSSEQDVDIYGTAWVMTLGSKLGSLHHRPIFQPSVVGALRQKQGLINHAGL